jgi:hypothetical protein
MCDFPQDGPMRWLKVKLTQARKAPISLALVMLS